MKKILLFLPFALLLWTCSTKLDILDNYKETTVVYCLLDQTQPKQYVRIEKAFLGPDNALNMAQQYDSISYIHELQVTVEGLRNGQVVQTFSTANGLIIPDTINSKDPGIFAAPKEVLYSFLTPAGALNPANEYKLTVTNTATNNTVTSIISLIGAFTIATPSSSISLEPTTAQPTFTYKWNPAVSARTYQPTLRFYYTEYYLNGDSAQKATAEMSFEQITTTDETSTLQQEVKVDKIGVYRFIGNQIPVDNNVVKRRARFLEFIVYAGSLELKDYIEINAPSTSLSQEHPLYTNIQNGYGLFGARSRSLIPATGSTYIFTLTSFSIDGHAATNFKGLANGPYTCQLNFEQTNGAIPGCQ
jgi:hypothetical protein